MEAGEYKHTLTLQRGVWFLRFYCWMWKADPSKANVCKLFWGYLFAWVSLLARLFWLLIWPLRRLLGRIDWEELDKPSEPKAEKEEVPGQIAEFFARPWPRRIAKGIGILGLVWVAAATGFGLFLLVPLIPGALAASLNWVLVTAVLHGLLLGIVFIIVIFGGTAWLDKRFQWDKRVKERKEQKRARGEMTFGDMFVYGAKAVKSNTCPRIEVVESERAKR